MPTVAAEDELALVLIGHLRAQRDDLAAQVLVFQRVAHERAQSVVVEFFRDVVIGAGLHRLNGHFYLGHRRDHDHLDQAVVLADDFQYFEAADARQADVEEHEVDVLLLEEGQRLLSRGSEEHFVVALEDGAERVAHPLVVVGDQNSFGL